MANKQEQRKNDRSTRSAPETVKRAPELIAEHKDWVVEAWLEKVKKSSELMRVSMTDADRKDHVPDLLDDAVAQACDHPVKIEERQKAAERHGTIRYHQGYSIGMLIFEAQLLQRVIWECLHDNVHRIDVESLIPDLATLSDTVTTELRESTTAYMSQCEWRSQRR